MHLVVCLPAKLRPRIIKRFHMSPASGGIHLNSLRSITHLYEYYYSKHLASEASNFVKSCSVCQQRKGQDSTFRLPMMQSETPSAPMDHLQADHCGPFCQSDGYKYLFVLHDKFSKFVCAYPCKSTSAEETANCLFNFMVNHGVPRKIQLDQHASFLSELIKELAKLFRVKRLFFLVYSPASNQTERAHQDLKRVLSMFCQSRQTDWSRTVQLMTFALNNTPKLRSSVKTPFYLHTGRLGNLDTGLDFSINHDDSMKNNYVQLRSKILEDAFQMVRENLIEASERTKKEYDKRVHPLRYAIDDIVYLKNFRQSDRTPNVPYSKGLKFPRFTGPYRIAEMRNLRVRLQHLTTGRFMNKFVNLRR